MAGQRFIGSYAGEQREIELEPVEEGRYEVIVDGVRHEADARQVEGGTWSLIIDGQSYDIELEVSGGHESEGQYNALVRGSLVRVTVRDERHIRMGVGVKQLKVDGPQVISTPMPGKIVKVLVDLGQEVSEGQPLIVVEAMKMENELRAPTAGVIAGILVREGQAVEAHAKLIAID